MKIVAKIVRIITVAPIMAFFLCTCMLTLTNTFSDIYLYFIALVCLCVIPTLAYPIESLTHVFGKHNPSLTGREAQRMLAIIFSLIGYAALITVSFLTKSQEMVKEIALTYLFSGLLIFIFSFIFKINASGHACGFTGPVVLLSYEVSPLFLVLLPLLIFIMWSSLKLKRHTPSQLVIGTLIPVVSLVISVLIIK